MSGKPKSQQDAARDKDVGAGDAQQTAPGFRPGLLAPTVGELFLQLMKRLPAGARGAIDYSRLARRASGARNRQDLLHVVDDLAAQLGDYLTGNAPPAALPAADDSTAPDADVLVQLLERLGMPDDLAGLATAIKEQLQRGVDWPALMESIDAIAELVAEMRRRIESGKQELDGFLGELADGCRQLDYDLSGEFLPDEARASGASLIAQLAELEAAVADAEDPAALKTTVSQHVGGMRKQVDALHEQVQQMERVTGQLQERMEREQRQTLRDPLTGLPNRLLIEERLRGELARAERYQAPVSVMLLDLDDFRNINRSCGHAAGDRMLKVIAGMIRSSIREADFIGRYGGEEFVVVFPETRVQDAMIIAEKLRVAISGSNFRYGERQISITASFGVTGCRSGDTVELLLERADGVLYEAKAAGRDRCISDTDMDAAQPG